MESLQKKTVAYFYEEEYGNFSLGGGNPMRPHRVRLTNNLVNAYGVTKNMVVHRPNAMTYEELNTFHADGTRFRSFSPAQLCVTLMFKA